MGLGVILAHCVIKDACFDMIWCVFNEFLMCLTISSVFGWLCGISSHFEGILDQFGCHLATFRRYGRGLEGTKWVKNGQKS